MREQPDLSLPTRVPEMERYHETPMELLPFALYALCELDHTRIEAYRQICTTSVEDDNVKLPPRYDFKDESLRSIVKYHVELGDGGDFDPRFFLVCAYADCSTAVIVTLDDDDLECKPDLLWAPMDESGLLCVNLQIANTDWYESKEEDLGGPQWSQPGPGGPSAEQEADDAPPEDTLHPGFGLVDFGPPPPVGHHIALYATDGVDSDDLLYQIHPGTDAHKRDRTQHICKLQHLSVAPSTDPAREAASFHLSFCAQHPTLQKQYFLMADSSQFLEDGVMLVCVELDGVVDSRTPEQLLEIGRHAKIDTQRAEVPWTERRAAVGLLCMMAQGYQVWAPSHKLFAVYSADGPGSDTHLQKEIDPGWVKRGHGEDRVAFGGTIKADEDDDFWPALLRKHFDCCKRHRFEPNFIPQYLIYAGEQPATQDKQVKLIKLDWAGDMPSLEAFLEDYDTRTSSCSVSVSNAHQLLSEVVEGKEAWAGVGI